MYGNQPMYNAQPGYVNPGFYQSPYTERLAQLQQPQQSPRDGLIRVTGMDGARAYQMPPNSAIALFDGEKDVFYVKTTDGAGFPTIRTFAFSPLQEAPQQPQEYVTRAEFDELKEMIINGKQSVRKQSRTESAPAASGE